MRISRVMKGFGPGLRRLCGVVAASDAREMRRQLGLALAQTSTVELRLDWLANDLERTKFLRWLGQQKFKNATYIATCRRVEGGGRLAGDIARELFWLIAARAAGCAWCDVEIETVRELPDQSVREYAVPRRVLLSVHDFERTPALPKTLNTGLRGEADAVKIAAYAKTLGDGLRLLKLAKKSRNFVAVPMGDVGLPLRILALREGSALAYAPVGEATAPGQLSLHEMKHLFRAHQLTRRPRVYGVIGDPVGHSLSPLMHN